jgi:hypothetical protein
MRHAAGNGKHRARRYHYRSHDGTKADFGRLRKLVGSDSGVEIRVREWYPKK